MNHEGAAASDHDHDWQEILAQRQDVLLRSKILASRLTTMSVGGELDSLVEVHSREAVQLALKTFHESDLSFRVIGFGSNLLVSDDGVRVPVLKLGNRLRSVEALGAGRFLVGGAMALMTLSRELSDDGFSGLEFAGGIPAGLGGAVKMNAGAHGGEMSEIIEEVRLVTSGGEYRVLSGGELEFSYRHSNVGEQDVVVGAVLKLSAGCREKSAALRNEYLSMRKRTQPLTQPSCGSVFKNPSPEKTAGWYLDQSGMKGEIIGGAEISDLHANWIVNPDRTAKFTDVVELVDLCRVAVRNKFAIELDTEMVRWN